MREADRALDKLVVMVILGFASQQVIVHCQDKRKYSSSSDSRSNRTMLASPGRALVPNTAQRSESLERPSCALCNAQLDRQASRSQLLTWTCRRWAALGDDGSEQERAVNGEGETL